MRWHAARDELLSVCVEHFSEVIHLLIENDHYSAGERKDE